MALKIRVICVLALATILLAPSVASAQFMEGVIYRLTPVRLGTQTQYVLVPQAVSQFRPDVPPSSSVPAAMGVLRYAAPDRYGQTSVQLTSDGATARVTIDPIVASQFEFIAAETVYTFTQLGVQSVEFPGLTETGLTRADIDYAAYRVQVPLWQALVGGAISEADVVLPGGDRIDAVSFFQRFASGDAELQRAALDLIENGTTTPAYALLSVVAGLEIDGFEQAVIPRLADADANLRGAALGALQGSSSPEAWEAIVGVMDADPEPTLRDASAQLLGRAPLESFHLYETLHRARGGLTPAGDAVAVLRARVEAIGAASAFDDPRMVAGLVSLLDEGGPEIDTAVIGTLTELSAWDALIGVQDDEARTPELRMAAATALADNASADAQVAGLSYRIATLEGDRARSALARLNTDVEGADPREPIESFLRHPDALVAVFAADLLAERGEAASLDALSEVGSDDATPEQVRLSSEAAAFTIMRALPLQEVEQFTYRGSTFIKRAAYQALGAQAQQGSGGARIFDLLVEGLASSSSAVAGAACRGIGLYANDAALDAIEGALSGASAAVEADCAFALANFNTSEALVDRAAPWVTGYADSDDDSIAIGGLFALGELGIQTMLGLALERIGSADDALVRRYALEAARKLADPADTRPAINGISAALRDADVDNRAFAVEQLGYFSEPLAVLTLSQVVNDANPAVRFAAIRAVGSTGHADAVAVLSGLLEDPDREVRVASIEALRALGLRAAIPQLEANIARDPDPVTQQLQTELLEFLQASGR